MLFISDVHDNPAALSRVVRLGEELAILGDIVNLTDYRTGEGAVSAVVGAEFSKLTSAARAKGDFQRMRELWVEHFDLPDRDVRGEISDQIENQYREAAAALEGGRGLVIHGNVDRPQLLEEYLPEGFEYVHGRRVERNGLSFGFIGGGIETPLQVPGEITDEQMAALLEEIGDVDVLCTHVPPALPSVRRDVVTGRIERGSEPLLGYLRSRQPRYHVFGDVHQPQATTWRVGRTTCFNAGYFRASGRFLRLRDGVIQVGGVG